MGDWYWIGLTCGLGVGVGVLLAGLLVPIRAGLVAAAVLAVAAGAGIGFAIDNWGEAIGGVAGGVAGVLSAGPLVRGTLQRGGTRGGTAVFMGLGALILAALALIPGVGYAEAVASPALGARLRRRATERYAGLRILARD